MFIKIIFNFTCFRVDFDKLLIQNKLNCLKHKILDH